MAYIVLESLKESGQVVTVPPRIFPSPWQFKNYSQLFGLVPLAQWFFNSLTITALSTIGAILSSTLGGFAFARLRFPGRDKLFAVCIATMMLPAIVTLIPQFMLFRYLGVINTFVPLILPSWLGVPFYMFFARQAFRSIPQEYIDAARVDGAGNWYVWARVVMPMSKPVVAVITIYSVIFNWNDFLGPLVYLSSSNKLTIALGLQTLVSAYSADWNLIMVGAILMTIPMIFVFVVAQRYFMETNISFGGLGGR